MSPKVASLAKKGKFLANRATQKVKRDFARFGIRGCVLDVVEQTLHDILAEVPSSGPTDHNTVRKYFGLKDTQSSHEATKVNKLWEILTAHLGEGEVNEFYVSRCRLNDLLEERRAGFIVGGVGRTAAL
ncbi:uncharacterized protein CDV56_102560 [Aspergillus thermomutatus]|uniref:Uncharacterized protein n=1 Tax=Aspergillus thermomutatus TaxID=41047 RepID=A0A397HUZ9_ASPTH|nr:uncharacterized protein CDV56_102560 [Aspergillus thermomutatus]RHZ64420.1 hypothetical protein CDV56_102560 [Aspergillus thermomutatus]